VPKTPDESLAFTKKANLLDRRTIYSDKQTKLLQTLETERVVFPPLEQSGRMLACKPDATAAKEKAVVLEDYHKHPPPLQVRSLFPRAHVKIVEYPSDDDMNSVVQQVLPLSRHWDNIYHPLV
jgi:hypothetical protein